MTKCPYAIDPSYFLQQDIEYFAKQNDDIQIMLDEINSPKQFVDMTPTEQSELLFNDANEYEHQLTLLSDDDLITNFVKVMNKPN